MNKIQAVREEDVPWSSGQRLVRNGTELRVHLRNPILYVEPGLWLGRARFDPGMRVEAHTWAFSEIMYIVGGTLNVGGQSHTAGTALRYDVGTKYGPVIAGPEGAEFLLVLDRAPRRAGAAEPSPKAEPRIGHGAGSGPLVVREDDVPWTDGRGTTINGQAALAHNRFVIQGGPGLQFTHVRYDPGMRVEPHAHPASEITLIIQGPLSIGSESHPAGTALGVPAGTMYGPLIAGAQGAEFLLFHDRDPLAAETGRAGGDGGSR